MVAMEAQKVSNLYNMAVHAKQENKDVDLLIIPFGHARLIYRVKDGQINLVLLRTRQEPLLIDNDESLENLQHGNIHNLARVETLRLAYDLIDNK